MIQTDTLLIRFRTKSKKLLKIGNEQIRGPDKWWGEERSSKLPLIGVLAIGQLKKDALLIRCH